MRGFLMVQEWDLQANFMKIKKKNKKLILLSWLWAQQRIIFISQFAGNTKKKWVSERISLIECVFKVESAIFIILTSSFFENNLNCMFEWTFFVILVEKSDDIYLKVAKKIINHEKFLYKLLKCQLHKNYQKKKLNKRKIIRLLFLTSRIYLHRNITIMRYYSMSIFYIFHFSHSQSKSLKLTVICAVDCCY